VDEWSTLGTDGIGEDRDAEGGTRERGTNLPFFRKPKVVHGCTKLVAFPLIGFADLVLPAKIICMKFA
jgi:hypothetical protein